jgi:phage terminase small subunit
MIQRWIEAILTIKFRSDPESGRSDSPSTRAGYSTCRRPAGAWHLRFSSRIVARTAARLSIYRPEAGLCLAGCTELDSAAAVPAAPLISDFVVTILSNSRHEAFARAILQGKSGREAYIAAGYKAAGAEANASRLIRNDKVSARIAELKGKAAEGAVATARQVLEELTKIGLSNMQNYVGARGQLLDVGQLTREHAAAIQEITVDTMGIGEDAPGAQRVKLKLYDKRAALVELGRHHKLFTDKAELTGKDGAPLVPEYTDEQRTKAVEVLFAKRRLAVKP